GCARRLQQPAGGRTGQPRRGRDVLAGPGLREDAGLRRVRRVPRSARHPAGPAALPADIARDGGRVLMRNLLSDPVRRNRAIVLVVLGAAALWWEVCYSKSVRFVWGLRDIYS